MTDHINNNDSEVLNKNLDKAIPENNNELNTHVLPVTEVELPRSSDELDHAIADASYLALRKAIGDRFAAAILDEKILVQEKPNSSPGSVGYGPVNFETWHNFLPESAKQHFNCRYCRSNMVVLASVAILNNDGTVEYPMVEALLECKDDLVINHLFTLHPELEARLRNETASRTAVFFPVAQLPKELAAGVVGGFEHFYAAEDQKTIDLYNNRHQEFRDFKYVEHLFANIMDQSMDVDLLEKFFVYVTASLGEKDYTALSHSKDVIQLFRNVRSMQEKSRKISPEAPKAMIYLWSLLQQTKNRWMRHMNGSVLGIVIDAMYEAKGEDKQDLAKILNNVKGLLQSATSGENYKQKTAESSDASVVQTYKFLTDKNLDKALMRRLLSIDEVKSVVWKEFEEQPVDAVQDKSLSPVEASMKALRDKKNESLKLNKQMDSILGGVVTQRRISLMEFIRSLSEFKYLELSNKTLTALPAIATAALVEGNYDELLNFDKEVFDTGSLLSTPQPYIYSTIAGMAQPEVNRAGPNNLEISAIFRSNRHQKDEDQCAYILHIDKFAQNFQKILTQFGTCVLGTMIKSEYFGHSRVLVELSAGIAMDVEAGAKAAGGVYLTVGTILNAVCQDGTKAQITIASVK